MSALTRVLKFLKPYTREALAAMVLLALVVGVDLYIPLLVQITIDQGVAARNMGVIVDTSLTMIGASVLSAILAIANTGFSVRAAQKFAADVRKAAYHRIQSFSFGNLDTFQTGRLLVRLTSDVNQLQMIVQIALRILIRAPLIVVGSICIMVAMNRQLATSILLLLPLTLVLAAVFVRVAQPLFMKIQKKLDGLNQVLQENLAGIRVVKAFVREDRENRRFNEANTDLMKESFKFVQITSMLLPLLRLLTNLSTVAVIYVGGLQTIAGGFTVGEIMAFINYLLSTMFPLSMLAMVAAQFSAANVSAERVMEIIEAEPHVQDRANAVTLATPTGTVAFEDVSFSYGGNFAEPVLKNINLVAESGQTVAILGATGSGKSSLVALIPRFYDVTGGRVTIDGRDVRDVTQTSLRAHIGMNLQEVVLFSGTIRDNVKYGREDATDDEVIAAARAAQAHEFIIGFPAGYDTVVGQRGVNLSGGQKQRIAIARALLVRPKILILDDSTRFVDVETEAKIHDALKELMKTSTNFVIAQRVSTVLNADKIVVLNNGEIAATGTHYELMRTSPLYREIYESQLGDGGDDDE